MQAKIKLQPGKSASVLTTLVFLLVTNVASAVYLPNEGRWLSRDPLEEEAGLNLYAYVGNNPILLNDIIGLEPPPVIRGFSTITGGPRSIPPWQTTPFHDFLFGLTPPYQLGPFSFTFGGSPLKPKLKSLCPIDNTGWNLNASVTPPLPFSKNDGNIGGGFSGPFFGGNFNAGAGYDFETRAVQGQVTASWTF